MFLDRELVRSWGERVARDPGVDLLVTAWRGQPASDRADRLAALGNLTQAAAIGPPGWAALHQGDVAGALRSVRGDQDVGRPRPATLLEAEALVASGAIAMGLRYLGQLSDAGHVAASIALARRQHSLGDHRGAVRTAARLPMNAHATHVTARALLALHLDGEALRRIEPFLLGGAPIPDTMSVGSFAVIAAAALARQGQTDQLHRFARTLLEAPDIPPDTMPTLARTAWTAGLARQAWDRFGDESDPWMAMARLELASLAGDAPLMRTLLARIGTSIGPAMSSLMLIDGTAPGGAEKEAGPAFEADSTYHIWRTHPTRWQPWIDAVRDNPGTTEVYDLAAGDLPDEHAIPTAALDDGALVSIVDPVPVAPRQPTGEGVWIDRDLCAGIGLGHDWPDDEQRALEARLPRAAPERAAVWITGADRALAHAGQGRPTVVLAPPGDPFWAGPLPERAWPACRVVRARPNEGWTGASERIAQAAADLGALPAPDPTAN